jgi:hypothetical protein
MLNEIDIHTQQAALDFGVQLHQVTPDMRRLTKTWSYAKIWGVRKTYGQVTGRPTSLVTTDLAEIEKRFLAGTR